MLWSLHRPDWLARLNPGLDRQHSSRLACCHSHLAGSEETGGGQVCAGWCLSSQARGAQSRAVPGMWVQMVAPHSRVKSRMADPAVRFHKNRNANLSETRQLCCRRICPLFVAVYECVDTYSGETGNAFATETGLGSNEHALTHSSGQESWSSTHGALTEPHFSSSAGAAEAATRAPSA